ncbi:MAG TPA: hypothetical protein VNA15_05960, partial [Candidatus Angelobacter sp.]|nr:hypothetical protein [Candidatus Angelobacter sp.]
ASATSTVTLSSLNGFTGTITLGTSVSPSGPTASLSSTTVVLSSGGTGTSTLTVQVSNTVALGNYTITVTANNGTRVHSAILLVNLKAVPDFGMATNPLVLTTVQGGSASSLITVTSLNGFSGSVFLNAQVSTGGVDVQMNPNNLNVRPGVNSSTTLLVSPHNDVIPSTYTVTLKGQSGSITHLAFLPLVVTSFTLDINPGSISFRPGSSGAFNILLTSINGFSGNITLSDQYNNQLTASLGSRLIYLPAGGTGSTTLTVSSSIQNSNNVQVIASAGRLSRNLQVQVFVNTQPDFFVSANPIFLAVPQGSSANSTITVTSVNGLSGNVNLHLGVNPGGPIVSINPLTLQLVSGGSASSILRVSVPSSVQVGIYSITVTGSDGPNHPVILTLYVNRPVPDFVLTSSPTSQTVLANNVATTTISLNNLNGFTGIVNLSSTVSPTTGLTCTLTPAVISGSQTSTLSCNGSAGTYSVTVTGNSGALTSSTVVTLTVQDFTISANAPTVSVTVGSSGNSTITITSLQGFSRAVILTSNNTACILTPSSVTGSATSTLSCNFASKGTFQVTVTGTSASLSHSTTVTFNVGGVADFTITASPSSLTVPANLTGNSTITVSPTNRFTGTITLSSSVSPSSGLLCSLNPTGVTLGSTSASTLSCSGSAGLYSVTVSGTNGTVTHKTNAAYTIQDYNVTASPSRVNASVNNAGASYITVTPLSGFSAVVSLSTNSTSCTISPTSLKGSGTATLSCAFSSIGRFDVGATGTSGSLSHSVTVTFIVNSAPSFTISASPTNATVLAGSNSIFTVTISGRNGFSGTVTLTSSVSPTTGLACALSPTALSLSNSTTSGTSKLTCSGSAGSYTVTVTGASSGFTSQTATVTMIVQDFTITGIPSSIGFNPGGTANSTINITGLQGFNGVVNLTASASSPSITASLNPTTATGSGTATLTVSGPASGSYSVTVSGTSGSLSHNVTITVNVGAGDFQISTNPTSINLYPGGTNTSIVSMTAMNGFTGNVSLSATVPSGLSALFSRNPVAAGATSTLTVSAASSIAAGTYTVTVTGTSGSLIHSVNISVPVLTKPIIAFVAATPVTGASSNSATTASLSFTKGNLIVVYITVGAGQTVSSITDSGSPSSTYTQRASAVNGNTILYLYTATAATSTNKTITVTMSASGYLQIAAAEYSGVIGFGASNTNTGPSTTPTLSLTTQNPNSWVIVAYGWTGSGIHSGDTGFTDRHAGSIGTQHLDYGDTNAAKPTGTYSYSATISQSDPWAMIALELV